MASRAEPNSRSLGGVKNIVATSAVVRRGVLRARHYFSTFLLSVAALTVASCTTTEENRLVEVGIGTDLYSSDTKENTELEELYLEYMCVQGGIGHLDSSNKPVCDVIDSDPLKWTIVVKAGFNDIDRRCDAYLAWLNAKRRTNRAILNQLSQTTTATQSIMRIAEASADAITIVGLVFGLARDAFTNYYSRLLLEVESSTVELIVTENRRNFRAALSDVPILIRPDAVHVLSSYLLICTPHVIENNINVRAQFSVSGNITPPQDFSGEDVRRTLTSSALLRAIPSDARSPLSFEDDGQNGKGTMPSEFISGAKSLYEQRITRLEGIDIQKKLCVEPALGNFYNKTRAAILLMKQVKFAGDDTDTINNDTQYTAVRSSDNCDEKEVNYANAYEKFRLETDQTVKAFQAKLAQCDNKLGVKSDSEYNTSVTQSGVFDDDTRNAIEKIKARLIDKGVITENASSELFKESYEEIVLCNKVL